MTATDPAVRMLRHLLNPKAVPASWQDLALCAETDPEAFFPEKGGSSRDAKAVCMACPVRAQCLDYALETHQLFGIWGGLSERQRRHLMRQQGRRAA
jgi:WhiB family redox-sensing transcriptional regulator